MMLGLVGYASTVSPPPLTTNVQLAPPSNDRQSPSPAAKIAVPFELTATARTSAGPAPVGFQVCPPSTLLTTAPAAPAYITFGRVGSNAKVETWACGAVADAICVNVLPASVLL